MGSCRPRGPKKPSRISRSHLPPATPSRANAKLKKMLADTQPLDTGTTRRQPFQNTKGSLLAGRVRSDLARPAARHRLASTQRWTRRKTPAVKRVPLVFIQMFRARTGLSQPQPQDRHSPMRVLIAGSLMFSGDTSVTPVSTNASTASPSRCRIIVFTPSRPMFWGSCTTMP